MVIQRLYEHLDELVDQATVLRDEFATTGDLSQLSKDTAGLGGDAYMVSNAVDRIIAALKLESE